MAIMMIAAFAMPLALAEETTDDATIENETALIPYGEDALVVLTSEEMEAEEAELEMNESASNAKVAWKQIQLWFTFKQEKKARIELEIARLRLIQAKIAARNNNTAAVEKALKAHEKIMNRVKERINKIDGVATKEAINATAAKLVGLERAIEVHQRRITFLSNMLATANLTEEQRARIEMRIQKMQNVTTKLAELNEEKKERLVTKLMAVANLTEKQAQKIVEAREKARENIKERIKASANASADVED